MLGYAGKILRVNLSDGTISTETPPESFYRRYLGGQGFVGYYLLKEVPKDADPLGPDNALIFAEGTVTGVPIAGAGRSHMGAKSPLTDAYGEADVGTRGRQHPARVSDAPAGQGGSRALSAYPYLHAGTVV